MSCHQARTPDEGRKTSTFERVDWNTFPRLHVPKSQEVRLPDIGDSSDDTGHEFPIGGNGQRVNAGVPVELCAAADG